LQESKKNKRRMKERESSVSSEEVPVGRGEGRKWQIKGEPKNALVKKAEKRRTTEPKSSMNPNLNPGTTKAKGKKKVVRDFREKGRQLLTMGSPSKGEGK